MQFKASILAFLAMPIFGALAQDDSVCLRTPAPKLRGS